MLNVRLTEEEIRVVQAKLRKLNRRAAKIGCAPLRLSIGEEIAEEGGSVPGFLLRFVFPVSIEGEVPAIDGWSFLAKIDYIRDRSSGEKETKKILRSLPGATVADEFRQTDGSRCDHCRKNIFRRSAFVLRHIDGREIIVGSTCIRDFLPFQNIEQIIQSVTFILEAQRLLEDDALFAGMGGRGCWSHIDLRALLSATSAVIRKFGWTSRSAAQTSLLRPTSAIVEEYFFAPLSSRRRNKDEAIEVQPEDEAIAIEAEAWARALDDRQISRSDYLFNLRQIAHSDRVHRDHIGFACSLVAAYLRTKGEAQLVHHQRQGFSSKRVDEYFGAVGEKFSAQASLLYSSRYESAFGSGRRYVFQAETGETLVYFTSGAGFDPEVGERVSLRGRIKAHEIYREKKQTILTRCKIESRESKNSNEGERV